MCRPTTRPAVTRSPSSTAIPRTGQDVTVDVVVVDEPFLPQPGGPMTIAVDPATPTPWSSPATATRPASHPAAAVRGRRGRSRRDRPVVVDPPHRSAHHVWPDGLRDDRRAASRASGDAGRVRCSLYPLDGAARHASGLHVRRPHDRWAPDRRTGLPRRGPRSADPRRPARRPVRRAHHPPRPPSAVQARAAVPGAVDAAPPTLPPDAGAGHDVSDGGRSLPRCLGWFAPLCLAAVRAGDGDRRAPPDHRQPTRRAPRPDRPRGAGRGDGQGPPAPHDRVPTCPARRSTVSRPQVNGSDDRVVGRRYPAHADDDGDVRLDADPYNAVGPIAWLVDGVGRRRAC